MLVKFYESMGHEVILSMHNENFPTPTQNTSSQTLIIRNLIKINQHQGLSRQKNNLFTRAKQISQTP
jgi:hypothetical protein